MISVFVPDPVQLAPRLSASSSLPCCPGANHSSPSGAISGVPAVVVHTHSPAPSTQQQRAAQCRRPTPLCCFASKCPIELFLSSAAARQRNFSGAVLRMQFSATQRHNPRLASTITASSLARHDELDMLLHSHYHIETDSPAPLQALPQTATPPCRLARDRDGSSRPKLLKP